MKFNIKLILVGGLAWYVSQFILSFITGPLIHEGVLNEYYMATNSFWRPELAQQPPDMAALMPRWITVGLIASFIMTGIFDNVRAAFDGSPVIKGLKFGGMCLLFYACMAAGWSGVFNLPDAIWAWWVFEGIFYYAVGGIVLGWVAGRIAPE